GAGGKVGQVDADTGGHQGGLVGDLGITDAAEGLAEEGAEFGGGNDVGGVFLAEVLADGPRDLARPLPGGDTGLRGGVRERLGDPALGEGDLAALVPGDQGEFVGEGDHGRCVVDLWCLGLGVWGSQFGMGQSTAMLWTSLTNSL